MYETAKRFTKRAVEIPATVKPPARPSTKLFKPKARNPREAQLQQLENRIRRDDLEAKIRQHGRDKDYFESVCRWRAELLDLIF